jgi:hypothetical protein
VPGLLARLGPIGMRSRLLMTVALRVMGNLVTEADRDVVGPGLAPGRPGQLRPGRPALRSPELHGVNDPSG